MAPPLIINRSVNDRCFVREWGGGGGWMCHCPRDAGPGVLLSWRCFFEGGIWG